MTRQLDGAEWRQRAADAGSVASTVTQFAVVLDSLLEAVAEEGRQISSEDAAKLLATLGLLEGPLETAHRYALEYQQIFFTLAAEADRKAEASGPRAVSRFPGRDAE